MKLWMIIAQTMVYLLVISLGMCGFCLDEVVSDKVIE